MAADDALFAPLQQFAGLEVLVVGDVMLDEYFWGEGSKISPEVPAPAVAWRERTFRPGGAANVANNIRALGGRPVLFGVIGDDEEGRLLRRVTEAAGIDVSGLVVDKERPTTRKTRIFSGRHQLLRLDRETSTPLPAELADRLGSEAEARSRDVQLIVLSDYSKGMLANGVAPRIVAAGRGAGRAVTAGPKPGNLSLFAGASFASLNRGEAAAAWNGGGQGEFEVETAGSGLLANHRLGALAITDGADGSTLFTPQQPPRQLPAREVAVFDVCGCGDSLLAAASMALAVAAKPETAVRLGNLAGAAAARSVGVAVVTPDDLRELGS